MTSCCSGYGGKTAFHFGPERAAADLARYRTSGLDLTTRILAEEIRREAAGDIGSLLDVGGGIGALTFTLLADTAASAVIVEASSAFLAAAQEEAERQRLDERITLTAGDFVETAPALGPADLVTMDRVVCCYPSATPLLEAGLAHARRYFAFSYPRERWAVRAMVVGENLGHRLRGNPFRSYVHPVAGMRSIMAREGFTLRRNRGTFKWMVEVWRKGVVPG